MSIKRPLTNPTPRDVDFIDVPIDINQSKIKESKPQKNQLKFDVDTPGEKRKQLVASVRTKLKKRRDEIEVSRFWKNPSISFMIAGFISNIVVLIGGGILLFGSMPPEFQLFYDSVLGTWPVDLKVDKTVFVFVIPIILICTLLVQYRLIKFIFNHDRRLAVATSWLMFYLTILLFVAIGQIYSLN